MKSHDRYQQRVLPTRVDLPVACGCCKRIYKQPWRKGMTKQHTDTKVPFPNRRRSHNFKGYRQFMPRTSTLLGRTTFPKSLVQIEQGLPAFSN